MTTTYDLPITKINRFSTRYIFSAVWRGLASGAYYWLDTDTNAWIVYIKYPNWATSIEAVNTEDDAIEFIESELAYRSDMSEVDMGWFYGEDTDTYGSDPQPPKALPNPTPTNAPEGVAEVCPGFEF